MWSNAQMLAAQRTPAETDWLRVFENAVFDSRNKRQESRLAQTRNSQRQLSVSSNTVPPN